MASRSLSFSLLLGLAIATAACSAPVADDDLATAESNLDQLDAGRASLLSAGYAEVGRSEYLQDIPSSPIYGITFVRGPDGPIGYTVIAASGATRRVKIARFEHADGRIAFATTDGVVGPVKRGRHLFNPRPVARRHWGGSGGRLAVDIVDASLTPAGLKLHIDAAMPAEVGYDYKTFKTDFVSRPDTGSRIYRIRGLTAAFRGPKLAPETVRSGTQTLDLGLEMDGLRIARVTIKSGSIVEFTADAPEVRSDLGEDIFDSVYSSHIDGGTYRLPIRPNGGGTCATSDSAIVQLVKTGLMSDAQGRALASVDAVIAGASGLSLRGANPLPAAFPWAVTFRASSNRNEYGARHTAGGQTYQLGLSLDDEGKARSFSMSTVGEQPWIRPTDTATGHYGGFDPSCVSEKDDGCFDEAFYLASHPDVAAAVQARTFTSGRHHYEVHGRSEGRATCAP